jgi:hypothetical protein
MAKTETEHTRPPAEDRSAAQQSGQQADGMQSVEVIAKLLNLSPRHLQRLAADGVIPKAARGRYQFVPVVQGYVRHLQQLVAARGNNELAQEQLRIARERADSLARANALARGDIIPREHVVAGVQETIAHCRARLLSIPSKAAPVVAMIDKPLDVKEKLTEFIHEALEELSRTRGVSLPEIAGRPGDGGGDHRGHGGVGAAAQIDGQRMGRSESNSKSRDQRGTR